MLEEEKLEIQVQDIEGNVEKILGWIYSAVNTVDVFVMKTTHKAIHYMENSSKKVKIVSLAKKVPISPKSTSNFVVFLSFYLWNNFSWFWLLSLKGIEDFTWFDTSKFWYFQFLILLNIFKKKSDIDLQNHFLRFQIHFHFHQNIKWQQTHIPQKSKTTFVVSFSHIPHKNWKCHFVSEYVRKSVKNSQHTSKYLVFSNKRTSVFQ